MLYTKVAKIFTSYICFTVLYNNIPLLLSQYSMEYYYANFFAFHGEIGLNCAIIFKIFQNFTCCPLFVTYFFQIKNMHIFCVSVYNIYILNI